MDISFRAATLSDAPLLAAMNKELIEDEGSRNPMTLEQLEARMRGFLEGDWRVLLLLVDGAIAGYVIYQLRRDEYFPEQPEVFVRHYLVRREFRGRGLGRRAFEKLAAEHFPPGAVISLDVLASNPGGYRFWTKLGFQPYCTHMRRNAARGVA